jgi:hypothetical protein
MPSFFIDRSSSLLGRFFFLSDGFADFCPMVWPMLGTTCDKVTILRRFSILLFDNVLTAFCDNFLTIF